MISSATSPHRNNHNNTTPNKIAQSEIDNQADTTCFGSNFTARALTGEQCNVSPFTDSYNKIVNVPIATAATTWDNPDTGKVIILIFHQGLCFRDTLPNSLIKPYQCWKHGIELCDGPFDSHGQLGITDPLTELTIPMDFKNSFVFLMTQAPTLAEINSHPYIEMADDAPWDPLTVGRKQLLWEEEQQAIIGSVTINDCMINCTMPEEPQLHLDGTKYDILLALCSSVYSDKTLLQCLVSSVQIVSCHDRDEIEELQQLQQKSGVGRTMAAIDTRARHTELLVKEVSRKFGIGLETARQTLKATTQFGIWHAVHPLSRR
jgi:hypothetical protein